jgi:hypothetical protein
MSQTSVLSTNNFGARNNRVMGWKQTLCLLAAVLFVCGCLGSTASAQPSPTISSFTVTDPNNSQNNCTYVVNAQNPPPLCNLAPGDKLVINGSNFDVSGNVGTCDCPSATIAPGGWTSSSITATVNFVTNDTNVIAVETVRGLYSPAYAYNPLGPQITSIQVGGCTAYSTQTTATCHIAVGQPVTINGKYFGTSMSGTSGLQVAMCDCANATINTWTNTQITVTATQVLPNSGVAVGLVGMMGWSNGISYSPGALEILVPPGAVADTNYSGNLTAMQQDPSVTGATITVYWSDFDCGTPNCGVNGTQYHWEVTNTAFPPWMEKQKKINIVLQMVSNAAQTQCPSSGVGSLGSATYGNCALPLWVPNLGSGYYTDNCNGQRTPNFFNSTIQNDYKNAIVALIDEYANTSSEFTGNYIRVALGHGGEILPSPDWSNNTSCFNTLIGTGWAGLPSNATTEDLVNAWFTQWLKPMVQSIGQLNLPMQIMGAITPMGTAPHSTCTGCEVPDEIAPIYAQNHMGFGSQGLEASDTTSTTSPYSDWVNLFKANPGVPLELQTLGQSCPGGAGQGICGTLNTGGFKCIVGTQTYTNQTLAGCTGDLPTLLSFASSTNASIFEVYYQDWDLAHVSAYCTTPGGKVNGVANGNTYCNNTIVGNSTYGAVTKSALDNNF